jgi:hypothetical protein
VPTDENPGDPPSRGRPLPEPVPCPPQLAELIVPERAAGFPGGAWPRDSEAIGIEAFSGCGGLTRALEKGGLAMAVPIEAWPKNGVYRAEHDLSRIEVAQRLISRIAAGYYRYIHFGLPCTSWSAIQRMNKGSRRLECPQGDGTVVDEVRANGLAEMVILCCRIQLDLGNYFSIENPRTSYLWSFDPVAKLAEDEGTLAIDFEQCMFGLGTNIDDIGKRRVKKSTRILTNIQGLAGLGIRCDKNHEHLNCLGHVKVGGCSRSLPRLAGEYPQELCHRWAKLVCDTVLPRPPGGRDERR